MLGAEFQGAAICLFQTRQIGAYLSNKSSLLFSFSVPYCSKRNQPIWSNQSSRLILQVLISAAGRGRDLHLFSRPLLIACSPPVSRRTARGVQTNSRVISPMKTRPRLKRHTTPLDVKWDLEHARCCEQDAAAIDDTMYQCSISGRRGAVNCASLVQSREMRDLGASRQRLLALSPKSIPSGG
jgi:hypothetical protein